MSKSQQPKCNRPTCDNRAAKSGSGFCTPHAYALGLLQPFVDRATAMKAVQDQLDQGHTLWSLHKAADLHPSTLYKFWAGDTTTWGADGMKRSTYEAIMDAPRFTEHMLVPSWPATRRVRSLRAAGHSLRSLTEYTGLNQSVLVDVSGAKAPNVRYYVDQVIRDMWDELHALPISDADPKVAKKGWPLPLEWIDIDDPQEHRGKLTKEQTEDRVPLTPELSDAADWLIDVHGGHNVAAAAIGITPTGLAKIKRGEHRIITREYDHRVRYAAEQSGWVSEDVQGWAA